MRQTSPKVLIVGSDLNGCHVAAEILTRFATVTRVPRIQDALSTAAESYDAIFCPWEFAEGTWRGVLEEAQKLDPPIPVIVLSRWAGEKQWVETLQAGAFDLLVPPFTNYQILAVLEHAMASRPRTADCCVTA
jgi:DNA-binding NtrC family response regulator